MPNPIQGQTPAPPTESDHWWNRIFPREVPPSPPPPSPTLPSAWDLLKPGGGEWSKTGLWDPSMGAAWDSARVGNRTLGQVAGTLYNENKGLRPGDPRKGFEDQTQLDKGANAMGHAILNGSFKGNSPGLVATSKVKKQETNTGSYKHYQELARQALWEHVNNNDPTKGRTQYNHRDTDDVGNRLVKNAKGKWVRDPNQPVFQRFGPFQDSSGKPKRIVIYGHDPSSTK
jgi:hypothetical protein